MTIGAAWIRNTSDGNELWMATDSRLSGDGYLWDDCPKVLLLRRRDMIIGFAGATGQAYPLLLQVSNSINSYRSASDGHLEFFHLVGHLERVINAMMSRRHVDSAVNGAAPERPEFSSPSDTLVVGGFSRGANGMVLKRLSYQKLSDSWSFSSVKPTASTGKGRVIAIFGDRRSKSQYRYLLKETLKEEGARKGALDLEPLITLARMLRMPASAIVPLPLGSRPTTIGGAPQVARVIPGADAATFAVRWPSLDDVTDFLQGRPIFSYENLSVPLLEFSGRGVKIHPPDKWPNGPEGPNKIQDQVDSPT